MFLNLTKAFESMGLLKFLGIGALSLSLLGNASASELYIDTTPEHYSIAKTREAGEKELFQMVENKRLEGAWLFARYSDGREVWHEAGLGEHEYIVTFDFNMLDTAIEDNLEELTMYHFHPKFIKSKDDYDITQVPSESDFRTCKLILDRIIENYPKHMDKFDCRLIMSTGTFTFEVSPEVFLGKKELEFEKALNNINHVLMFKDYGYEYSISNRENFVKLNEKFAKELSTKLLKISFKKK